MINVIAKTDLPTTQHTHMNTHLHLRGWKAAWEVSVCLRGGQRYSRGRLKPRKCGELSWWPAEAGALQIMVLRREGRGGEGAVLDLKRPHLLRMSSWWAMSSTCTSESICTAADGCSDRCFLAKR